MINYDCVAHEPESILSIMYDYSTKLLFAIAWGNADTWVNGIISKT